MGVCQHGGVGAAPLGREDMGPSASLGEQVLAITRGWGSGPVAASGSCRPCWLKEEPQTRSDSNREPLKAPGIEGTLDRSRGRRAGGVGDRDWKETLDLEKGGLGSLSTHRRVSTLRLEGMTMSPRKSRASSPWGQRSSEVVGVAGLWLVPECPFNPAVAVGPP